jgi:hypothetical protein
MTKKHNPKPIRFEDLLGTSDKKVQIQRVQQLIEINKQLAQAKVIDLVIQHDTRTGGTDVFALGFSQLDYRAVLFIMDKARQVIVDRMTEATQADKVATGASSEVEAGKDTENHKDTEPSKPSE